MAHLVTGDPDEAAAARSAGIDVVLVVGPGPVPPAGAGPGRLAILVDPAHPPDPAVAAEMAAELFGRSGPGGPGTT